jgi:hypothetical protein
MDNIAEEWERNAQGCHETNIQPIPNNPFATWEAYEYIPCGIKKQGMKTYYDNLLKAENTALRFPSFINGDGVQKLEASRSDVQPLREWELHTIDNMRWNGNPQSPIQYWSRDIIKSMRWLMRQAVYTEHFIFADQRCFHNYSPPNRLYTEMHTADWWWERQER